MLHSFDAVLCLMMVLDNNNNNNNNLLHLYCAFLDTQSTLPSKGVSPHPPRDDTWKHVVLVSSLKFFTQDVYKCPLPHNNENTDIWSTSTSQIYLDFF